MIEITQGVTELTSMIFPYLALVLWSLTVEFKCQFEISAEQESSQVSV